MALPSVIVPDGAIDAQSLIALADLVVSAGGTMNREAVALGTAVYTTYGGLSFASELKALRTLPDFRGKLDPDAPEAYFTFNSIPSPLTIFRDVRKLEPGTLLSWPPGSAPQLRRWCRPAPVPAHEVRSDDERELAAELADRLRDSVRGHLGGALDPAPVTRLLDEHVARRDDHSRAPWGLLSFVLWQEHAQR